MRVALGILALVEVVGVVGYRLLGLGWFDAIYQTAITVTTVGFGEVGGAHVDTDEFGQGGTLGGVASESDLPIEVVAVVPTGIAGGGARQYEREKERRHAEWYQHEVTATHCSASSQKPSKP